MFYVAIIYYCIREKKYILLFSLLLLCYLALVMSLRMLNHTGIMDCVPLPVYIVFE